VKIIEKLLTINPYSRSGRRLAVCRGIVFHYVGVPKQRAINTWGYFEKACPAEKHYSSAHYIIDLNGDIYHAVPDDEAAWHCGSDIKDPISGRIYTDWAREKYGYYASDPVKISPNYCTIGIELCIDAQGNFTPETLRAAAELAAKLLEDNRLSVDDIGHHKLVVGWKDCPLPWVKNPLLFDEFKEEVRARLGFLI
jgi:N-acetylmuramoyl-L-alanine amidase